MKRSEEQIQYAYEIEKGLANKLRDASKEERLGLYSSVYNEYFKKVPLDPARGHNKADFLRNQIKIVRPFLKKQAVFVEIGAGDCAFSIEMAKHVKQVYAIEVSDEINQKLISPSNFKLIISDGSNIPLSRNSINIVYSFQVMEHIHADDALDHLIDVYNILLPGGAYICITPNKMYGPSDVSMYFDDEATGFHLREYRIFELKELFKRVGFSKIRLCVGGNAQYFIIPTWPIILLERILLKLPYKFSKIISRLQPFRALLHIRLIGVK